MTGFDGRLKVGGSAEARFQLLAIEEFGLVVEHTDRFNEECGPFAGIPELRGMRRSDLPDFVVRREADAYIGDNDARVWDEPWVLAEVKRRKDISRLWVAGGEERSYVTNEDYVKYRAVDRLSNHEVFVVFWVDEVREWRFVPITSRLWCNGSGDGADRKWVPWLKMAKLPDQPQLLDRPGPDALFGAGFRQLTMRLRAS